MPIDPKFIINLNGKPYPQYGGILSAAHELGLASIETDLIQVPAEENGNTAIVRAVVRMKDGSTFADYGDANPKNTSTRVATALIRMASTRSKGRALRDAINCGETMLEELPPEHEEPSPAARNGAQTPHAAARAREAAGGGPAAAAPPAKTGFEATYGEAGTRHWTRVEMIEEVRLLLEKARALGIEKPAVDLQAAKNPRLMAMVQTLRQEIEAKAPEPAGAEGA